MTKTNQQSSHSNVTLKHMYDRWADGLSRMRAVQRETAVMLASSLASYPQVFTHAGWMP